MTQRQVLGDEICTPFKDDCNNRKNQRELDGHPAKDTHIPLWLKRSMITLLYVILTRHSGFG
jgi:hypothetical protein